MGRRILAFEGWDAGSHRAVRRSIERHARFDWRFETLPGRAPKWRLRLGALDLAARWRSIERDSGGGAEAFQPDAVLATSMLSLADLRAILPASLRSRPFILSMHENQAAYPIAERAPAGTEERDAHLAFTNLASIEAADRVTWNSDWNRESFIEGMRAILRHAPESIGDGWEHRLRGKSVVVPPPVEFAEIEDAAILRNTPAADYQDRAGRHPRELLVAWPHRWEHDKGCDELLETAERAASEEAAGGPAIRWVILGDSRNEPPAAMQRFLKRHRDRIAHAGNVDRPTYLSWLHACDWVLSTARHEFFGLAVAEALVARCLPWLPNHLAYPELVPEDAIELDPWSLEPGRDTEELKDRIVAGLRRADGPAAVAALEAAITEAIETDQP